MAGGAAVRLAAPAAVLAAFLLLAALWFVWPAAYGAITALPDGLHRRLPFEDLAAILQAGTCWQRGVNVYMPSTCLGGGVYNYAPALLRAANLGLTVRDRMPGGVLLVVCFAAALAAVPPARSGRHAAVLVAAAVSPPVLYALEQGNFDVVIFCAVCVALRIHGRAPLVAYGVFGLAALCKFYPAALFALVIREPRARLVLVAPALAAGFAFYVAVFGHASATAVAQLPFSQPFRATFGAVDLPLGLALLWQRATLYIAPFYPAAELAGLHAGALLASCGLLGLAGWRAVAEAPPHRQAARGEDERLFLVAGLLLMVCCFCAAQNVSYRSIFLLLALPGLLQMGHRRLVAAVMLLLWEAVPRHVLAHSPWLAGFWVLREMLWWWVMVQFGAILVAEWRTVKNKSAAFCDQKAAKKRC